MPVSPPGRACRGLLPANESHGEGANLRKDRLAVVLSRDRGLHRPAEVPQPPAGERGRDRQAVVAGSQALVGPRAITTRAVQPLSEEQLLHRPAVSEVAREQRAQLIVGPDPLIQEVDQSVDGRLAADPFEQVSTTERPETQRVIKEAAVLKTDPVCGARPGRGRFRGGAARRLPAEGSGVLLPLASRGACLLRGGGLLLRHGCVHLRRDPAHPAEGRACLPDSG